MKKTIIISMLLVISLFILQSYEKSYTTGNKQDNASFYTTEAKAVIDKKCYGCHSVKGKSQDAKDKLMWDSLPGLRKSKIVATLNDIVEQLDENKMPPPEFLKKFPDAALLTMERASLKAWAQVKADSLLK
ncbi:MAG TPA: hypothetical protein VK155_08650 [Bacteroidales bacterium]|jgi:cytochrome c553|nr:hypothetical protein [Bacteroidales bacterium]